MIPTVDLEELDLQLVMEEQRLEIQQALTEKQRAERLREYERLLNQPRCGPGENNTFPGGRWQ